MTLLELRVSDLGVIGDELLVLGPGMTALTGETGAGKTLIVEAIELLIGGRSDPVLVRSGAAEAVVEGRFVTGPDGREVVLRRAVPSEGRSRAYVDGRMSGAAALAAEASELVDLHGQHAHQSLLSPAVQRSALDAAGAVDLAPLEAARARLREVRASQEALGGDARSRAREADLLRFQVDELAAAGLSDPGEDAALRDQEERLADAGAARTALEGLADAVNGDGGAADRLGAALGALAGRAPLSGMHDRLHGLLAELADLAVDARSAGEAWIDDPARLAEVGERRHLLADLRRKYGDTLGEVIAYRDSAAARLEEIASHDARAAALEAEADAAGAAVAAAEAALGEARRAAAGPFARAVERRLRALALPGARFGVEVAGPAGEEVTWLLGANRGQPALPLTKVASGGELARTMLAARLVLSGVGTDGRAGSAGGARTLVFDEVDAGIGGAAAVAVGRALAGVARRHQVLVVTHLPQVAAFADHHLVVTKDSTRGSTIGRVRAAMGDDRVVELSRMLAGRPDSDAARRHAAELLAQAGAVEG